MAKILITGTAGFIGFHLAERLLSEGHEIVGIDNINDYYDPSLKLARLNESGISGDMAVNWNIEVKSHKHYLYKFIRINLEDKRSVIDLCVKEKFDIIVNLAAQAGVRYSITNPDAYVQSNIVGFLNILEASKLISVKHLVYASSSSVYGLNKEMPFSEKHNVDHPVSLYATSKKANELMAHTYSHLFNIPTTGLRFFTVYGPWGRPDMAAFLFSEAIQNNKPIKVFNQGQMKRDFTYIDDIVFGISSVIKKPPVAKEGSIEQFGPSSSTAPYRVLNIGNNKPVALLDFIAQIENSMQKKALKEYFDMQDGDVVATWANVDDLIKEYGYNPSTDLNVGIHKFVDWFTNYYNYK